MSKIHPHNRAEMDARLRRISDAIEKIIAGDFATPVDAVEGDTDSVNQILLNLDALRSEFYESQEKLQGQTLANALRARIWRIAADKTLGVHTLIQQLVNEIGPGLEISRVVFCRVYPDKKTARSEVAWSKEGVQTDEGVSFPNWIIPKVVKPPFSVLRTRTLPAAIQKVVGPFLKKYKVCSVIAVPYGNPDIPTGLLTVDDGENDREWTEDEIAVVLDVVRIIEARTEQIQADELLQRANRELEMKVAENTDDLNNANEKLKADIVDLRAAEDALKESERRFRAVTNSTHEAIVSTDSHGITVFWNRGAEVMFGYKAREIMGKPITTILGDFEGNTILPGLAETRFANGIPEEFAYSLEGTGRRNDGSAFPIDMSITAWQSRGEGFFTAILRDATMRKQAVRRFAEEKELLDVSLRSIGDGVVSSDLQGNVSYLNRVAEELTGFSQEGAIGTPLNVVLNLRDPKGRKDYHKVLASVIEDREVEGAEYRTLTSKDGKEHDVSFGSSPMRDRDEAVVGAVTVVRDIGEQRRMRDEIFRARKLESVGVLAGGIAHDFNNILTGIITNLFMAKTLTGDSEELHALIHEAERAAFRASNLTKQLLTFSKGGAPVKENASLRELIEDSVGFSLSGSNVECILNLADDLWPVEIDRGQIDQVLNNLIINGVQAMPSGGIITLTAVNMTIDDKVNDNTEAHLPLSPGTYIKVSVKDQGVGIPRKNLEKIFDPYFTTKDDGNGLGLTTVYSIINNHGGFITVKSRVNKGTTFLFYLPATDTEVETETSKEIELHRGSGRILIMDDEAVIRTVLRKLLTTAGYDVCCVRSGEDAVREYVVGMKQNSPYTLVIMDLTVPGGMGGREAAEKVLEVDPNANIIVSSGYSNDPVLANYESYGFKNVIAKPFNVNELLQVVKDSVESAYGKDG